MSVRTFTVAPAYAPGMTGFYYCHSAEEAIRAWMMSTSAYKGPVPLTDPEGVRVFVREWDSDLQGEGPTQKFRARITVEKER